MDLNLPRSQMSVSQCKFALKESWKGEKGLSPAYGPLRFVTSHSHFAHSPLFAPDEETGFDTPLKDNSFDFVTQKRRYQCRQFIILV